MRQIIGSTLVRSRELQNEVSQRELARRVAKCLDRPARATALQKGISRIELASEPSRLPGDLVDALEVELGLELGDLSHPYRWVFRITASHGRDDRLAWLGGRLPVFSAAAKAYEARGWVTLGEGRVIRELEPAHPYEIFHGELARALGGEWTRSALDPPYSDFMELAGLPTAA
jgi:hypothetical protein